MLSVIFMRQYLGFKGVRSMMIVNWRESNENAQRLSSAGPAIRT